MTDLSPKQKEQRAFEDRLNYETHRPKADPDIEKFMREAIKQMRGRNWKWADIGRFFSRTPRRMRQIWNKVKDDKGRG